MYIHVFGVDHEGIVKEEEGETQEMEAKATHACSRRYNSVYTCINSIGNYTDRNSVLVASDSAADALTV